MTSFWYKVLQIRKIRSDRDVLHTLRTTDGISLSVVDELRSISSLASSKSDVENNISSSMTWVRGEVGKDLLELDGSLNADLYWS